MVTMTPEEQVALAIITADAEAKRLFKSEVMGTANEKTRTQAVAFAISCMITIGLLDGGLPEADVIAFGDRCIVDDAMRAAGFRVMETCD